MRRRERLEELTTADEIRRLVDEYKAAEILGVTVFQMRRWRWMKGGPQYVKVGRIVRYQIASLDAFIARLPAGGSRVA